MDLLVFPSSPPLYYPPTYYGLSYCPKYLICSLLAWNSPAFHHSGDSYCLIHYFKAMAPFEYQTYCCPLKGLSAYLDESDACHLLLLYEFWVGQASLRFIFYILCDYASHCRDFFYLKLLVYRKVVSQKHDFLFQFFQSPFSSLPYLNFMEVINLQRDFF